ncbi:hypothetical protein QTP93_00305 [Staphylococcus borealis]|nr:hypothetical protein [Staphylococcus borealis]MDM7862402.1 hypothetical protein [Staphylococcus borealis]
MKLLLDNGRFHASVIIPDRVEFEDITSNIASHYRPLIRQAGYVYDYQKSNQYTKQILNLTNSDDIPNLEKIIQQCKDYQFHIGAITEMSAKLMDLGKYDNVKLYPTITQEKVHHLFATCDVYLDINKGGEIVNAIERAMVNNQLIIAYDETAHRRAFISEKNITQQSEPQQLIEILNEVAQDKKQFKQRIVAQQEKNNSIDQRTFKTIVNDAIQ